MYTVDLNFWSFVLCMGLFFTVTSIRSIEDAYFEMQVAVDGNCSDEELINATTVIGFVINKTDSEIWRCSNTCAQISQITNCNKSVQKVACLFTVADAKTIANRDNITHILADISANSAVNRTFYYYRKYAFCSTFEYINRTSNLTECERLKHIKESIRGSHGTTNPIGLTSPPTIWSGGSNGTTNPIGLTSPPSRGAYFEVHLSIDNHCDEDAILKATNMLRSVLHRNDKKIWRCQDNCTLDTNCSGGQLTFCLFFEADEYTRTNSSELNSSLSKDVTCGYGELVLEPSPEFCNLQAIANSGTGNITELCRGINEPQTGGGPGTGAIVGGTVGGLAGLAGAILAGWRILRKLKKNQVDDTASTGDTTPITPGGIDFEEAPNSVPPAGV